MPNEISKADSLNASLVLDVLTGKVDPSKVVFDEPDREATARRIAEQDANAQSKEELLGKNTIGGKNYVNRPFELRSVDWQVGEDQYAVEGAVGFYAVLHGVDPQGKSVTVTCGAASVMRKAAVLATKGWLPAWVQIKAGKATANGTPLDLEDASEFAPFASK